MTARTLMFQGTGSDVGKSVIVAGLCRVFTRRGHRVLPFKPQNMSNNAAVTPDGGEIGRAQALQAIACGVDLSVHMNPVLLKPQSDVGAQVVVRGKATGTAGASYYREHRQTLLNTVIESFEILKAQADIVLVEGAGSPAEINLRAGDIANMGFATATQTPVVLIGDIDRGGVIASIVGTHGLLQDNERDLICGFLINKFRGDLSLFDDGVKAIVDRTSWKSFGVLPHVPAVRSLPAEDAVALDHAQDTAKGGILIAVPMLSRIANFDDVDPLQAEADVTVQFIPPGQPLPGDAQLVLIPGTKSTTADMAFFRAQGWDIDLAAHHRRGGRILGICGGYQMLGSKIDDPDGVDGPAQCMDGLGMLNIATLMTPDKTVRRTQAQCPTLGCSATGYEIHVGDTTGVDVEERPFFQVDGRNIGATSPDGSVMGGYVHGMFEDDTFRASFLAPFRSGEHREMHYGNRVTEALDDLAEAMEQHLDVEALWESMSN
ncbi:MAG: cobyric acid synthase [Rhodospirillales bacterium]|jgi:adenosylcobyric acid synthase|nr:cobyric acid synthase [Rhodospirillales bacterium]